MVSQFSPSNLSASPVNIVQRASGFQVLTGQVPYSQEVEEALIGSIMVNPDAYNDVCEIVKAEDFYILRHIYIWEAIVRLAGRENSAMDYLILQEELRAMGRLNEIGGPAFLIQLINATPTSMHALWYAHLVQRTAIRRRLLAAADEIKGFAMDEEMDAETVEAQTEKSVTNAFSTLTRKRETAWIDIIHQQFDDVEYRMDNPDTLIGLPTGFRELDELLCGLQRSDLIILGGRPGSGKTAFSTNVAINVAINYGKVGMFTREMTPEQIGYRAISSEAHIDMQKLRLGKLDQREWSRYVQAAGRVGSAKFYVDGDSKTVARIRSKSLRWMRDFGLDLIIIDYLQLLLSSYDDRAVARPQNRSQEVEQITYSLKDLAKELDIPILALAQLNRGVEARQDNRPILSDLKESGGIEAAADVVMFMYRDVMYNVDTEFPNRAEIITAKHRNGPTGVTNLYFDKTLTKFLDSRTQTIDLRGL